MDQHISRQLNFVVRRLIRLRCWWVLSWFWSLTALASALLVMTVPTGETAVTVSTVLIAIIWLGPAWLLRYRRVSEQDRLATARLIEQRWPALDQRLLTVIEQAPSSGGFSWLQQELATEVRSHACVNDWRQAVPLRKILMRVATAVCALLLSLSLINQLKTEAGSIIASSGEAVPEEVQTTGSIDPFNVTIEPGTAEVERGTALLITALFEGRLPSTVTMLPVNADAGMGAKEADEEDQAASGRPMRQSLKDPLFGTRLPSVDASFDYQIQYDDQKSEVFRISVYDLPQIVQVDARVEFPSYTDIPDEVIEDTWRVSTVEGSSVVLTCRLNKEVSDGRLIDREGDEFELVAAADLPKPHAVPPAGDAGQTSDLRPGVLYQARIPVDKTRRLTFSLVDDKGRRNRDEDEFILTAIPNRPPEIKLTFPGRDLRVSPIEELQLEATIWDDFGISEHGVVLALADREPKTVALGEKAAARQKHELAHLVALELENAKPDQLVSYYFFADDVGVSGEKRRTMSDMFFAEVRHFEEIFREGQAPPGGAPPAQSAGARKAEELGDLQKQIISATWKIIRRETRDEVSDAFADDVTLLIESQQAAIEQMNELMEELQDTQSKLFAEDVIASMKEAVVRLAKTHEDMRAELLTPALSSERAAYQGLLKLRAREHQVTQQQSSQSSQSSGSKSASQQQLDQLELDNKKNRYEAEKKADQQEQEQQNREELQVLNRLRELARRQGDLNQKLKELEHELKAAKTEEEREEIERQLKRLREEQQELLRDVDELKDRLEKPENQQEMADTRDKLEETRSKVRQASEALEKGKLSQALNEGTRAERELEELRDEVRQKAAGQFGEAMRDLRQQAREIGERQDQIADALNRTAPKQGDRPSLRPDQKPAAENLQNELDDQKEQLDRVMEQMRDVVEKAETAEPLLARQLYETVRKTRSDRADEALDETRELHRRGLNKDAAVAEKRAHEGLDRMQKGIEQAAEAVLGNELETLKRASRELADAGKAVQQELAEEAPAELQKMRNGRGPAGSENQKDQQQNDAQDGQGKPSPDSGENSESQQDGQPSQASENSSDQQKPGEGQPSDAQQSGKNGDKQQADSEGKPKSSGQPGDPEVGDMPPSDGQETGQEPGEKPAPSTQQGKGKQPGSQGQPNESNPGGQPSNSEGQQKSATPGDQQGQGENPKGSGESPGAKPQEGKGQPGQSPEGKGEGQSPSDSQGQPSGQPSGSRQRPGLRPPSSNQQSPPSPQQSATAQQGGNTTGPGNPITGEGFVQWSDQIRNVEELIDDPKMRAEVARIREAARSMRAEFKRHSKEPQWGLVRMKILEPLSEIQEKLKEEIARRESPDSLVPIDRDPVPDKYAELVRRYYERIGSGK